MNIDQYAIIERFESITKTGDIKFMIKDKNRQNICTHSFDDEYRVKGSIVPPMFLNSLFTRKKTDTPYSYSRVSNPTIDLLENKITALEQGAWTRCFTSGMAAISACILAYCKSGDHIICVKNVYSGFQALNNNHLKRYNIHTDYVDGRFIEEFRKSINENTKIIYLESPTSLVFDMVDLEEVCSLAIEHKCLVLMDNTWSTPIYQNPIKYGIDIVIHSCTKYMAGHSDLLAGSVTGKDICTLSALNSVRSDFGGTIDPHQAWMLTRGLRTLPLRMKQHQESAKRFCLEFADHPKIVGILYPGFEQYPQKQLADKYLSGYSGLLSLLIDSDYNNVHKALKTLEYFEEGCSWGGYESLYIMLNKSDYDLFKDYKNSTLIRISIGLEDTDTLIEDFKNALNKL